MKDVLIPSTWDFICRPYKSSGFSKPLKTTNWASGAAESIDNKPKAAALLYWINIALNTSATKFKARGARAT